MSYSRLLPLLATVCALALGANAQTTRTLSFQNGVAGYSGALEVGIEKGKGVLDTKPINLLVGRKADRASATAEQESQALVRFDGIFGAKPSQIPPGSNITKATLRLNVGALKSAASYHRVFLNRMLVPWDKNASWENPQWGNDGIKADGTRAVTAPDALFIPNRNNTAYDIDVTESLRAWSRGEPNHGWVLLTTRAQYVPAAFMTSRLEKGIERRPMLTVTYDALPGVKPPVVADLSSTPSSGASSSATLSLKASADGIKLPGVTFYGRKRATAAPGFEVVLLPDTQYYTAIKHGGKPEILTSQVDWIVKNHKQRGIAFVLHLGDISDTGDVYENEWEIASRDGLHRLENPATTGLPDGVPYAVAVGNHDQRHKDATGKITWNGPTAFYNKYFGVGHFKSKGYYGGNFGANNNNYYTLFDAGAEKFIVISLEYDFAKRSPGVLPWAEQLLKQHAGRHGIVITHATIMPGFEAAFQQDGENAYNALKGCPNLMLIIGGHTEGEGWRTDKHQGSVVHSLIMDFQQGEGGGNGWLGILAFSPRENKIRVRMYSPWLDQWRSDEYATWSLDYDFGAKIHPFAKIASVKPGPDGTATCIWRNLAPGGDYEWYAEVSDGRKTTRSEPQTLIMPTPPSPR